MFNPDTYNVNSNSGSVNMTYSYEGVAYEPEFTNSGSIIITGTSNSATYTIEDYVHPATSRVLTDFINELYSYGLPKTTALTLITEGYVVTNYQDEAESLMDTLNYISQQSLSYGEVEQPDVSVTGTYTVDYGANITGRQLVSVITVNVGDSSYQNDAISFSGTIIQAAPTVPGSITITPSSKTVASSDTSTTFAVSSVGVSNLTVQSYSV